MPVIDPNTNPYLATNNSFHIQQKKKKEAHFSNIGFNSFLKEKKRPETITLSNLNLIDENEPIEKEDVSELMSEIHQLGKKLNSSNSLQDLMDYREAVKKFITFITKNNYQSNKRLHKDKSNLFNKKEYITINIINEKLEALGRDFLATQNKNLNLLAEVDEIQFLLFDLIA